MSFESVRFGKSYFFRENSVKNKIKNATWFVNKGLLKKEHARKSLDMIWH